ncbi:MAG TPA: tetratricopeptide repeat protein [Nitrospirales bacterium]|jgi:tetratricopeptide (TPR) repeat protein
MRTLGLAVVLLVIISACSSLPRFYEFHDPLTAQEHLALGVSYESQGETTSAIAEYKRVIEIAPDRDGVTARVFLGNLYTGLEQFQTAEQYYREALALDSHRVQALNNLASMYVKQGAKLGEAETLARTAVAEAERGNSAGQQGVYLETLGEVLLEQGRYSEALKNFQKAETFNDNGKPYWLIQLYAKMAEAYERLGQTAEAREARERSRSFAN